MKSKEKIIKKNNKHNLGKFNRELVIRLAKIDKKNILNVSPCPYKEKITFGSIFEKLGFLEIHKNKTKKIINLDINRKKIRDSIELGATFHILVYKILIGYKNNDLG